MPHDPHDRTGGGLDPQSDRWWRELTWLDEAERDQIARVTPADELRWRREARRAERRRQRSSGGAGSRGGRGGRGGVGRKGKRSLLTFFAVLLVAFGAISMVEGAWQRTREASFAEGGHLDGTTVEGQSGVYAFLSTQPGTKQPVTYGACRTIEVEINSSGEVPGGSQMVLEAMARVSELTGLELTYAGPSVERPDVWRERMTNGGLEAYPPVLVSWSDEDETPGLAEDVVGLGGSISLRGGDYATQRYMTGSVTLDGPDLNEIYEQEGGEDQVRAVIMHEFGHLVGLGHVQDPGELMSESNSGQLDFGPGDKEGLARLGSEDC